MAYTDNSTRIHQASLRFGSCTIEYYANGEPMINFHGQIKDAVAQQSQAEELAQQMKQLIDSYNEERT